MNWSDVTDFGAVGAGADDISAFVAAANTGKQVCVPDGDFTINIVTQAQFSAIAPMFNRLHLFCRSLAINIGPGVFVAESATRFQVTNGSRLKMVGAEPVSLTFIALASVVSNGAQDHRVTVEFVDASSVDVGDFILVRDLTGSRYAPIEGVWKVTAKSGNNVTFKVTAKPPNLSGIAIGSGTFKKMTTVLQYGDSLGLEVACDMGATSGNLCGFDRMVIAGNGLGLYSGVFVEYDCTVSVGADFCVHGFGRNGFYCIYAGTLNALGAVASANGVTGFYAANGSTIQAVGGVSTGNGSYGIVSSGDSQVAGSNSNASGSVSGYYCSGGSSMICNNLLAQSNTAIGVYADENSYIDATDGVTSLNDVGVKTADSSIIVFTSGTGAQNTTIDASEADLLSRIIGGTFGTKGMSTPPAKILSASLVHNFGTIPAQSQVVSPSVQMVGVMPSKTVVVAGSNGAIVDGLVITAHPVAVDSIKFVATNIKGTSITVSNRTFYAQAFVQY